MPTEPRVLADFEGTWNLTRQITHDTGARATFDGRAIWTPDAQGMQYRESGQLKMPGSPAMQAERRYLWRDPLEVYFADGRFFHQIPAMGGTAQHWCDPDTYLVQYDFEAWPAFSTVWQVTGPKKAYEMISHYRQC